MYTDPLFADIVALETTAPSSPPQKPLGYNHRAALWRIDREGFVPLHAPGFNSRATFTSLNRHGLVEIVMKKFFSGKEIECALLTDSGREWISAHPDRARR